MTSDDNIIPERLIWQFNLENTFNPPPLGTLAIYNNTNDLFEQLLNEVNLIKERLDKLEKPKCYDI